MRRTLAIALLALTGALTGCAEGPPAQPYTASYTSDPPPFYSDAIYGRPVVLAHPYHCPDCGWAWR